jgi:hypothetical protein
MFMSKLADSDAEAAETQVWLDFARDCGYLSAEHHSELIARYEEIGRMLHAMIEHPERFVPSSDRQDNKESAVGSKLKPMAA